MHYDQDKRKLLWFSSRI